MCKEYNYCQEKEHHHLREDQGYDGDVCPHCFKELQEYAEQLQKKVWELEERLEFLERR